MPSTTQRKKEVSEKAIPSYPARSRPELLIQYDEWVDAARVFAPDLMQQLYEPLVLGTIALIKTLDPDNPVVVELKAASGLVWEMKAELARRSHEIAFPTTTPCYKPRFDDPQVIERLVLRIARIRQIAKLELHEDPSDRLNRDVHVPIQFPIKNTDLAKMADLRPATVAKQMRNALKEAKQARSGGRGIDRDWTQFQARKARPGLPNGKLKKLFVESAL